MALKANDKPEFSSDWWTSEKPDDVKGKELEKALECVEEKLDETEEDCSAVSCDAAVAALKELEKAVAKTISKECDKKKHKDAIAVLEKFSKLIKDEVKRLDEEKAKCKDDEDKGAKSSGDDAAEDEDEKRIFTKDYVYKKIKKVRQGETYNFALGLNLENPGASDLLLSVRQKPERLYQMLKKHKDASGKLAYSARCLCCGTIYKSPDNAKILAFKLGDGEGEPPRFFKTTRVMLRSDKKLLFKKANLICGNKVIDDPEPLTAEDGDDTEAEGKPGVADLQQRLRSAATAAGIWTRSCQSVAEQVEKLRRELSGFDDVDVKSVNDRLANLVDRYPKLDFTALTSAADAATFDRALTQTRGVVAKWRSLLSSDQALLNIDKNPFGVSTNVCGTFGDALTSIEAELKA